jgi:NADPH-dependent 2,4-dienoyl-CoA reductase/sulfur reductase-like enzyme
MAEEILRQRRIEAGRYMVIGGGLVGLETAEHLCHAGADVTVIEMLDELGSGLSPMRLKLILDRLIKSGVNLLTKARVISIQDRMARIELPSGVITMGPYNSVVVATGYESERALAEALGNEIPVKIIGDAREPRSIREAISEGLDCGLDIVG